MDLLFLQLKSSLSILMVVQLQWARIELYVRGPTVFSGYLDEPDLTAACITPDGWFKTGWSSLAISLDYVLPGHCLCTISHRFS